MKVSATEAARVRLTLHSFESDVPPGKVCRPGVEYRTLEAEVGPGEALAFFERLVRPRDSFYLEASGRLVNFWKHGPSVWVEITAEELWAASEVSPEEAEAVIEALHRGESFGPRVPSSGREWDAYSVPADERAAGDSGRVPAAAEGALADD